MIIKINRNKGQSLWEVVIALAISSLVALGLVRLTSSSIKTTRFSSDQSRMRLLMESKRSEIINEANENPVSFWSNGYLTLEGEVYNETDDYCIKTDIVDVSGDDHILPTTTPNYSSARILSIAIDIFWGSGSRGNNNLECSDVYFAHTLRFETYLSNK